MQLFNIPLISTILGAALTGSAMAATHTVNVGGLPNSAALTFVPSSMNIAVGDTVMFAFNGLHTASQGSSADPCTPASPADFDFSGNPGQMFNHTFSTAGSFNVMCKIPGHCAAGMHGVILVGSSASASASPSSTSSANTGGSGGLYGAPSSSAASTLIPVALGCLLTGATMIALA